jgi:transposase-like protein
MSAALVQIDATAARVLTDKIKIAVEGTWHLITEAYQSGAHLSLGYSSWDEYVLREFGTSRLRLPREERQEVVGSMRDSGMSIRAIASAVGMNHQTVANDLSKNRQLPEPVEYEPSGLDEFVAVNTATGEVLDAPLTDEECAAIEAERAEPVKVTGVDGKSYTASRSPIQPKQARTDVVAVIGSVLNRAEDAAHAADRITADHLREKKEQAARWHRDLSNHMQSLQRLLDALQEASE